MAGETYDPIPSTDKFRQFLIDALDPMGTGSMDPRGWSDPAQLTQALGGGILAGAGPMPARPASQLEGLMKVIPQMVGGGKHFQELNTGSQQALKETVKDLGFGQWNAPWQLHPAAPWDYNSYMNAGMKGSPISYKEYEDFLGHLSDEQFKNFQSWFGDVSSKHALAKKSPVDVGVESMTKGGKPAAQLGKKPGGLTPEEAQTVLKNGTFFGKPLDPDFKYSLQQLANKAKSSSEEFSETTRIPEHILDKAAFEKNPLGGSWVSMYKLLTPTPGKKHLSDAAVDALDAANMKMKGLSDEEIAAALGKNPGADIFQVAGHPELGPVGEKFAVSSPIAKLRRPLKEGDLVSPPRPQWGDPGFPWPQGEMEGKAKLGGFTTPVYHGRNLQSDLQEFPARDILRPEGDYKPDMPLIGRSKIYTSSSPKIGDMYGSSLTQHPDEINPRDFHQGAVHIPMLLNTEKYHVIDAKGKSWANVNSKAINEAKEMGAPGVTIKNVYDEPSTHGVLSHPTDVTVILEGGGHTARSPFAQFQPSKFHLPDLLAGLGGGAVLPWLGGSGAEQR